MATYVYDRDLGIMVDKATREPMNSAPWVPALPMVFGDTPGYASPIDGTWIDGRRARKYDLEKNNCVDANDLNRPMSLKNQRFVEKHGLQNLTDQ